MRAKSRMMAAGAAIEFSGILKGLQVVGHRDHREKDHEEHQQRNGLHPLTNSTQAGMAYPKPRADHGQHHPDEIED
jgi:hypothetical protein